MLRGRQGGCEGLGAFSEVDEDDPATGASGTHRLVAEELRLSIRTVERHVQNIYAKTGVHHLTHAALWARDHGAE